MNCCGHTKDTSRFFSFFAGRYCKKFKKKGFEPSQKQLMSGLLDADVSGQTVLEIGCGVGHLHQTLLEKGATIAVGVDLSPKMLQLAQQWAQERGIGDRVRYLEGDFLLRRDDITPADVTVLDKVICCYPDMDALVDASLAKTTRLYAYTIPRNRLLVRMAMGFGAFLMWLIRSDFRSYVHDPDQIEEKVIAAGFQKVHEAQTVVWLSKVYKKG